MMKSNILFRQIRFRFIDICMTLNTFQDTTDPTCASVVLDVWESVLSQSSLYASVMTFDVLC